MRESLVCIVIRAKYYFGSYLRYTEHCVNIACGRRIAHIFVGRVRFSTLRLLLVIITLIIHNVPFRRFLFWSAPWFCLRKPTVQVFWSVGDDVKPQPINHWPRAFVYDEPHHRWNHKRPLAMTSCYIRVSSSSCQNTQAHLHLHLDPENMFLAEKDTHIIREIKKHFCAKLESKFGVWINI